MSTESVDDRHARGAAIAAEMFGTSPMDDVVRADTDGWAAEIARLAVEQCYGDIWSRPGLSPRDRSLVTLGVLVAQRQTDELAHHVRGGLRNGLSTEEVREAVLHTLPYVGFPALASALEGSEPALAAHVAPPGEPTG